MNPSRDLKKFILAVLSPAPVHLFAYSTVLVLQLQELVTSDTDTYHAGNWYSYYHLRLRSLTRLFRIQALCPPLLALTCPFSLKSGRYALTVTAPLVVMMLVGALNEFLVGPGIKRTLARLMLPGKANSCPKDWIERSEERRKIRKALFVQAQIAGMWTRVSSFATIIYGFQLGRRMQ
jgi:hypothetical protein